MPGYTSMMRYFPDHGVAIAFQITTDGGISDGTEPLHEFLFDMQISLAEIAANRIGQE